MPRDRVSGGTQAQPWLLGVKLVKVDAGVGTVAGARKVRALFQGLMTLHHFSAQPEQHFVG